MSNKSENKSLENAVGIIDCFGGIRPMATKMNIPVTTVQGWKKRNAIPSVRLRQILTAAEEYNIDLSSVIEGVTEKSASKNPANDSKIEYSKSAPASSDAQKIEKQPIPEAIKTDKKNTASADESLLKEIKATESNNVLKSILISTLIVVAVLGAIILTFWPEQSDIAPPQEQTNNQETAESERIRQLEEELAALKNNIETAQSDQAGLFDGLAADGFQQSFADMTERAQMLSQTVREEALEFQENILAENAGTLQNRLTNAQQQAGRLFESEAIQTMVDRLQSWQNNLAGQEQIRMTQDSLIALFSGIDREQTSQNVGEVIDQARQSDPVLAESFAGVPQEDLKAAALLIGLNQFRTSLNRQGDFSEDLMLLQNLIGAEEDSTLNASLQRLAPHAEQGVLTSDSLSAEFRALTGDVIVASLKGEDVSLQDRTQAKLHEFLQIEKNGEAMTATPTQAALEKAQTHLDQGDVESALDSLQGLDTNSMDMLQPWIEKAQATLLGQNAKRNIELFVRRNVNAIRHGSAGSITTQGGTALPFSGSTLIQDEESGLTVLKPNTTP